jgi:hypothetical protein
MAADASLIARLEELIALFNRKGMDVPDGLFDRRTAFCLNGETFEALLGRPSPDPLVLMLTRGAAGYRFAVKALQHALPDVRIERGEVEQAALNGAPQASTSVWLSGHTRGTGETVDTVVSIELVIDTAGIVLTASATFDEDALATIREARLRP